DEKCGDLIFGHGAIEHGAERRFGLALVKRVIDRRELGHATAFFAAIPQIARKLRRRSCPCSVAMLSGWNCTPWIGSSRWRKPITLVPSRPGVSLVALTTRTSGTSSTTRE